MNDLQWIQLSAVLAIMACICIISWLEWLHFLDQKVRQLASSLRHLDDVLLSKDTPQQRISRAVTAFERALQKREDTL